MSELELNAFENSSRLLYSLAVTFCSYTTSS
jgi:hypothetical protein